MPWEEAVRFYFNLPSQGLLAAVDPLLWKACERKRELVEGEPCGLGFDGSHSQDGTALVACFADGYLAPVEIIERPPKVESWRVDRTKIERALETMFGTYDVKFLYADPWKWQNELDDWAERWPDKVVEFPTNSNKRMVPAVDRFRSGLTEGSYSHDGDPDLRRHVLNARLRKVGRDDDGRGRYSLEKAGAGRLMDAAVAAVLAVEAAAQITDEPDTEPMFAWV